MKRCLRAGLAAAGLLAAPAWAEDPPAGPPLEIRSAGSLTFEPGLGRWTAAGGALLQRGTLTLRAGSARWDPAEQTVDARGGVLLAEPGRALLAEALTLKLGGAFEAREVRAYLKERPEDLSQCSDDAAVRSRGRNRLTFAGDRISGRSGSDRVVLEGARITLCDCPSGPPSWEVRARSADIVLGRRALLDWPVLYVTPRFLGIERPVPVMGLPWGYLPLAERQTGVLLPELRLDRNGLGAALPVFVVLSRSWDATVTPEWITGPTASQVEKDQRGVRGPGLGLELRWAPAEGASGLARLHLVDSTISRWPDGAWRPPGGDRLSLILEHQQRLGPDAALGADLALAGDPFYVSDFTGDVLLRGAEYRRSALSAWWRGDDLLLSGEAHYLQPLTGALAAPGAPAAPYGLFGSNLSTFHRLPSLTATLLPRRLLGPLRLGGALQLSRFGPLRGATGDEGADGVGPGDRLWGFIPNSAVPPLPRDAGERDGSWEVGERLAATRARLRAELTAPITAWRFLLAEPWAAASAAGYAFDAALPAQSDGRLAGGFALSTELSRRYERDGTRFLHTVSPRLEWRTGSASRGPALPSGYAYDEWDVAPAPARGFTLLPDAATGPVRVPSRALSAAPTAGWQQLRFGVRNRLAAGAGASPVTLDLDLGQDLDLGSGQARAAEAFCALGLRAGVLAADLHARFHAFGASRPPGSPEPVTPSWLDGFPELQATVSVGSPRGELHASFQAYGPGGSQRLAAGTDPFFDPRPIGLDASAIATAGFRVSGSAATLAYDLQATARTLATPLVENGRTSAHVFQQTARFTWDSPCRCFKLGLVVALREGRSLPDVGLTFDLPASAAR